MSEVSRAQTLAQRVLLHEAGGRTEPEALAKAAARRGAAARAAGRSDWYDGRHGIVKGRGAPVSSFAVKAYHKWIGIRSPTHRHRGRSTAG